MLRSAVGKVMWVGRATVFLVGLAVILALVFGAATTAMGATGGNFILGKANVATTVSKLTASIAGPALTLVNRSTEAAATALNINVASGKAPLKVNAAAGTATNLSADELDGEDSAAYQRRVSGECPAEESIRSIGADGASVTCEPDDQGDGGTAQVNQLRSDLGTNDGTPNEATDPVSFSKVKDVPADVLGRNAATLEGKTASQFAKSAHQHSGEDVTSGTVAEARIDGALSRDAEVMGTVNANDGAGSGLDADKLDGKEPNQLPGSIASFGTFAGGIGSIAGDSSAYVFAGPTATVTTSANERLFGAAQAALALSSGTQYFDYGLCYQSSAGGNVLNFVGTDYSTSQLTTTRTSYPATASVAPGAGTWQVGFCVRNSHTQTINNADLVNGWVQVVNHP